MASPLPPPPSRSQILSFDQFELDLEAQQLRKAGAVVRLQPQPFKVLLVLVSRAGKVVSRDDLRREVWGGETFVDFEQGLNFCVRQVRVVLGDDAQSPRYVETIPRRGYRFVARVEGLHEGPAADSGVSAAKQSAGGSLGRRLAASGFMRWPWIAVGAVLLVVGLVVSVRPFFSRTKALGEADTVVLADFTNTTADPVFDQTLKQGLIVQLEQSPFLSILPDQRIHETLELMALPAGAPFTAETARQVCIRTASTTLIAGSIHKLGYEYVIGLEATNCRTGDSLDHEQAEVNRKEDVLSALGSVSGRLRRKLGESVASIQKFDTPLEQATTPSLDALHAYSLGLISMRKGDFPGAVPYLKQAIELDPNFAMAHAALGTSYNNSGEISFAAPNFQIAYDRRAQVSARERFYIESRYFHFLKGDLEQARKVYELWHREYPRDPTPIADLAYIDGQLGHNENSVEWDREALRLDPESTERYANLAYDYLFLARLQQAQATADQALARNLDSPHLRILLYSLAFMRNDQAGMTRQIAWCEGKPGIDHFMLHFQARTAAYHGNLRKAREFTQRAIALAESANDMDEAADYIAEEAIWEALFGNAGEARRNARSALAISKAQGVKIEAAFALAFAGDIALAGTVSDELNKRYPEDTLVHFYYLPTIRSQLALDRGDYQKAAELLRAASPYESGTVALPFYAVYVRGEASLAAHQSEEAATEFHKILDHPGIVLEDPIGPLARLAMARALRLQARNTPQAGAAYQDFLSLWNDGDPDIPILKQARREFAQLR